MTRAFIFPGQGSQAVGMGLALSQGFPAAKLVFEEVDEALKQKLSKLMFEGPEADLILTENAQPALMAVSVAALRVLEGEGGWRLADRAAYVAGHSLGEYSALAAAGALSLTDAARLLKLRGQAMQKAVPVGAGAMAAVLGPELEQVQKIAKQAAEETKLVCSVANDNSPGQVVVSGAKEAVERAMAIATEQGVKRSILLPVSAPFHCALMQPAADAMQEALSNATIRQPVGTGRRQRHGGAGQRPRDHREAAGATGDGDGALAGIGDRDEGPRRRQDVRTGRRQSAGRPRQTHRQGNRSDVRRCPGGCRNSAESAGMNRGTVHFPFPPCGGRMRKLSEAEPSLAGAGWGVAHRVVRIAGGDNLEGSSAASPPIPTFPARGEGVHRVRCEHMFDLTGKSALVTGASGGIGGEIARALHKQGANVALSGTRVEPLEKLKAELGERAHVLPCDLSDPASIEQLLKSADAALSGVDILVNNAGLTRDNLALRMKDEDWSKVIEVNLTAGFRLARGAMRGMMKKRWGRIIGITSVVGHTGNPGQANYAAAKAGMVGMSKALAAEVASRGITVNCVAPGFIETNMTDALNDEQKARIVGNIPAGRLGQVADVAAAVVYLASVEAAYVTGQTIHVNGGMAMI